MSDRPPARQRPCPTHRGSKIAVRGQHAAMVLTDDIDLLNFPQHWVHGFKVVRDTDDGLRHSLQIFDVAGDAVCKVFLRTGSDLAAWQALVADLAAGDVSQSLHTALRAAPEGAKADLTKLDILRAEWARMTDTHRFMRLLAFAWGHCRQSWLHSNSFRPDQDTAPDGTMAESDGPALKSASAHRSHCRSMAGVKPTKRIDAISVEAFDAEGRHILHVFGQRSEKTDMADLAAWNQSAADLRVMSATI
jgi:putative hemin transport protein